MLTVGLCAAVLGEEPGSNVVFVGRPLESCDEAIDFTRGGDSAQLLKGAF